MQQLPGNLEKLYKRVYKIKVAKGMWEQKGRISAVLTMNAAKALVLPPQSLVWEPGKEDLKQLKGRCSEDTSSS